MTVISGGTGVLGSNHAEVMDMSSFLYEGSRSYTPFFSEQSGKLCKESCNRPVAP